MSNGFNRFYHYLSQIEIQLKTAQNEENPAMWLLNNNSRTPFFMLEALARIYSELHNKKKFNRLNEHFKSIEDGIGKIDHYESLLSASSENNQIPTETLKFLVEQRDKGFADLNKILKSNDWIANNNKRIKKIIKKLKKADWLNEKKEALAISKFYESTTNKIVDSLKDKKYHFTDIELDVHELRRDLRWLSIYAQALQGLIQFDTALSNKPHLQKYLTEEIVNSPYNQLPDKGNLNHIILVSKNHFLSLSWMIAELGKLKDEGLMYTGLIEALVKSSNYPEEKAISFANNIFGEKQVNISNILKEAESISKIYFEENNLQQLVVGINPLS